MDQNSESERENYSYQIHNSEAANITLACMPEVEENYIHKICRLDKKVKCLDFPLLIGWRFWRMAATS